MYTENIAVNPFMNNEYNQTESIFVVSGIIGVLEKWIIDDFKTQSTSVANMLNRIILKVNNY